MANVTVRFQPTPNPNAGKFIVDRAVVEGPASRSYYSREQAAGDALADALFGLAGVASLFMVEDFITVTKTAAATWDRLIPEVVATIERAMP